MQQQQQKAAGDFNIPQPRFQTRNSININEPFTPTGFLRSNNVNNYHHQNVATNSHQAGINKSPSGLIPESPSDLKQLKGRLGRRFHQQQQLQRSQQHMIDNLEERQQAAEE
jgi:hypothetical protein